jgi:hypothetical protein
MGVPPGNRPAAPRDWFRGVPERYIAGADTRGRQEGRPYPWSQQVIHEISGLVRLNGRVWHQGNMPGSFYGHGYSSLVSGTVAGNPPGN